MCQCKGRHFLLVTSKIPVMSYHLLLKKGQVGIPYLSKFPDQFSPDQFSNVSIFPVANLLLMYKFFGSVNEVESHNKSRQSNIALDKF